MTRKKLLVIDNNEDYSTIISYTLENQTDWEISTARNGREGIVAAKTNLPDGILLDLMPDLEGLDVCKTLKSDLYTSQIPIVFMTVMSRREINLLNINLNWVKGLIFKPFDPIDLSILT
jgi:DNA-binding response OmpR family regulator